MTTNEFVILSIDPGTTDLGWAVSKATYGTCKMEVLDMGHLKPTQVISTKPYRQEVERFGKRPISLRYIREHIEVLIQKYHPDFYVSEGCFGGQFFTAIEALIQSISTIRQLLLIKYQEPLHIISPKEIKKAASGFGGSGKGEVATAVLLSNSDITFSKDLNITDTIPSHVSDAIAIAYSFLKLKSNIIEGIHHERFDQIPAPGHPETPA